MVSVVHKHPELGTFLLQGVLLTGTKIGSGAYSTVEEGKIAGAVCAVKRFDGIFQWRSRASQVDVQPVADKFAEACRQMSTLRHPHIVQFLGICLVPKSRLPALVMERMLTNLHDLLESHPNIPLSLKYSFLYDLAKGISYLHSRPPPLVHRDLSARNVLLNTALEAKIDVGAARMMRSLTATTTTRTPIVTVYTPPEVHARDCHYDKEIDIFSFGVVAILTLTQQFPAGKNRDQEQTPLAPAELKGQRECLQQQVYRQFSEDHPVVQMTKMCLERFQSQRPMIQEVMQLLQNAMARIDDRECSMSRLELVQTAKEYYKLREQTQSHQAQIQSPQAKIEQLKGQALQGARMSGATADVSTSSHSTPASTQRSYGLEPGVCGLNNLGNTCYMNSALQCLSNTEPLTEYFMEQTFMEHINKDNPLGSSGAVAETYNDLLQDLWCGQYCSFSPAQFKALVDAVTSQFSGDLQHDSQEFLAFLLDGLHEDLNRVTEKPHVDMSIETKGTDEDLAQTFWQKHLQRNKSIVVDLFQGQLRSTVKCLQCNEVSKTFDPFMFLSLPLPAKTMYPILVVVIKADSMGQMVKYCVEVPCDGTVANVKEEISLFTGIKEEGMVVANVRNGWFTKLYEDRDSITTILSDIYIYELRRTGPDVIHISVIHYCNFLPHGVIPTIISVPKTMCTHQQIYQAVLNRCGQNEHVKARGNIKTGNGTMMKEGGVIQVTFCKKYGTNMYELQRKDTPIDPNSISYLQCDWPTERCRDIQAADAIIEDSSCAISPVPSQDTTLFKCLNLFTKKKKLGPHDAWFCSNCKGLVKATRKCDIWRLPPILVINLTRFSHNRHWKSKIHTLVHFPIEDLNMSEYVKAPDQPKTSYDLFAVINHYGGMTGGHYTAYCKNKATGRWYAYHDDYVSKISEERVLTSNAYVLFYHHHEEEMDLD